MNTHLLHQPTVAQYLLQSAAWSESHGAADDYLGMGLLYYSLVYILRAKVAVCLGSGGGFVPRLMRQAQRDLGLAETSRTVLVDGNQPAAGWGAPDWLAPNSFFRQNYPDVELVLDLTRNAARTYFEAQGLTIDYLHIDADHSFAGCLADFETYAPFLRAGSLVTLHDTHYPGAGVGPVVEHIRTLTGCEVIDWPEVGMGTALVRIGQPMGAHVSASQPAPPGGSALARVVRQGDLAPRVPPGKEWKYLESPAFASRYVLAASFVSACQAVIEIGGAKTPIDQFLTSAPESVVVVDPLIRQSYQTTLHGQPCAVSHLRARFQEIEWQIPAGLRYGLVMLGMDFEGFTPEDWAQLWGLIDQATMTVIEFPPSWESSRRQFEALRANTRTRLTFQARLDLDGNDFGSLENSWPPRVDRALYVLEPA